MQAARQGRRHAAVLVSTLILLASANGRVSADSTEVPQDQVTTEVAADSLTQAVAFRKQFGFDSDPGAVVAAESDAALARDFGVALTAAEEASMNDRVRIQKSLGPLTEELLKLPDFGASTSINRLVD